MANLDCHELRVASLAVLALPIIQSVTMARLMYRKELSLLQASNFLLEDDNYNGTLYGV